MADMSFTTRFVSFQLMIIAPFVAGYLTKHRYARPEVFAKRLIRANLMVFEPLIALWSIWGLNLKADLVYLPMAGLAMVLTGLLLGRALVGCAHLTGPSRASFIISASIANHGFTMGGFICYLFFGEKGLGLSFIFLSYFMPYIFLVIFPYARSSGGFRRLNFIRDFVFNPQNLPLYAIITAVALRASGLERPRIFFPIDALLMVSIALYYFTLGINFAFGDLLAFRREHALLGGIRFLLLPALVLAVLVTVHLDPLCEAVILIEAFMPTAVYSVMSSVLFDLDVKRASSMFVFNTVVFLAVGLPCLMLFKGVLLRLIA